MKSLRLFGLVALAAATLYGQPADGPVYWSPVPPDCSSLAGQSPVAITNASGTTVGYSCYVSGTFVWVAAGGGWGTSIRVAAPASAAIGVDLAFYDAKGDSLRLDTTFGSGSPRSADGVKFALSRNQPVEVRLLGAASNAPAYNSTATGSVYAAFYCPDAMTCANVLTQAILSTLPATSCSVSTPISWDTELWTQWSAQGIDDGGARRVSLAIYNEDITATSYTLRVYDSTGALAATGTTRPIAPLRPLGGGLFGQGETYGVLLTDVISTPLPSGVFKIVIDGASKYSAVQVFQFDGPSATTLQVIYDSEPGAGSKAASVGRPDFRSARIASMSKGVFGRLAK